MTSEKQRTAVGRSAPLEQDPGRLLTGRPRAAAGSRTTSGSTSAARSASGQPCIRCGRRGARCRVGRQQDAVRAAELAGDDADPAVPEVDQVLRGVPGAATVVDVDAGGAGHGVLVDVDQRQAASPQPAERGLVAVAGVDQRPRPSARPAPAPARRARPTRAA